MAEPSATRTKEEDAAQARVGSTLRGKWRLDSLLGVGGVAAVYAATHRNGQRAALKIMHEALARDRSIVQRFLREAYVANKVGHPACARVLDDDTTEADEPFLVMELLEGETVRDFWRRTGRTIPTQKALHIAERVLDCLAACHALGIVHRDLKPANIFLTTSGAVKLLDFGVAREEGIRQEGDKTLGLALGTPAYMSPEQAKGQLDRIDGRSDLFSIGALLHALITGKRIHRGKTEKESLHLAANEPVPSVATVDASLVPELVRLIDRALAWDIDKRFPTAREMQSAVISAMRVVDTTARRAPAVVEDEDVDLPELTPVHEVIAREDPRVREVEAMLRTWQEALVAGILHGFESGSAEGSLRAAFDACVEIQRRRSTAITLVIRPYGLAAFDHVLWQPDVALAPVPHRLFEAGVRALRLTQGLTFEELRTMLACIAQPGDVDVAGALWEAVLPHVRIDACMVAFVGDVNAREAFATEALRDEKEAAHRVHAARDAGAAWNDAASPLAPEDAIRAVYASQLGVDRWGERYAELFAEGLVQAARARNVGAPLGALRKVAIDLHTTRRYEEAQTLRRALVERLAQRVGSKDAPKLAAAVTSAMLGKEALDALIRTVAHNPSDVRRVAKQLEDVPPGEAGTVIAVASSRPLPEDLHGLVSNLVMRIAGPDAAEALGDRPSAVPTWRNELTASALLPRDERMERHARVVTAFAAVLEQTPGHTNAVGELAELLAQETADGPFEVFFAEAAAFVGGRMLLAERAGHDAASRVSALLARCGAHALAVSGAPTAGHLEAFAKAVRDVLDRAAPLPSVGPLSLRAMSQAARTRGVVMERLAIEPRVMRVRSSAVAAIRAHGGLSAPRVLAHVARSIVDVAAAPGWLIEAATEPELVPDQASRAVSAAILAAAMARLLVDDRAQIVRIVLAALTPGAGDEPDALGRWAASMVPQTTGQRTSLARAVIAYELAWTSRSDRDGPPYHGAHPPTLHARIGSFARRYVELLAEKGLPPPTPQSVVATLAAQTQDTADRTVLRLLVASLGFVPAGTVVRLSSGETAEVIQSNRGLGRGPVARLVLDESGEEYSEPFEVELALGGDEGLRIEKIVSMEHWRKGEQIPQVARGEPTAAPPLAVEPPPAVEQETMETSGARPATARQPTASGTLATTPLVHTLVYMLDRGLSGTIELREPDGTTHHMQFVRGGAARARTGRLIAPLGGILVQSGWLREDELPNAVAAATKAGVRLGEHLVKADLVARVDLLHALETQVTRKVAALVNLDPRTTFAFYRNEDLMGDVATEPLEVDPLGTIFAAARAWEDRERMRKVLESAQHIELAIHPDSTVDLVDLDVAERTVVAALRAYPMKLAALIANHPPAVVEPWLFAAIVTRQIVIPGQTKPPMGLRAAASSKPSGPPKRKISWKDVVAVREAPTAAKKSAAPTASAVEAVATIRRAEQALSQKDIDGAKSIAEQALALDKTSAHAGAFFGWVRMLKGELTPAKAIEEVEEALKRDDACLPARLYRAKLLKREGRLHEAMRDLEVVLAAEPENREAKNELRVLLLTIRPQR